MALKRKTKKFQNQKYNWLKKEKMNTLQEENTMSDLKKYIAKRKKVDSEFVDNFEDGYQEFKIGEMLKMARKETGLTQEDVATAMHTKKSAISRIENHAQDIRLSTLQAFAHIMGKELKIQLV